MTLSGSTVSVFGFTVVAWGLTVALGLTVEAVFQVVALGSTPPWGMPSEFGFAPA